MPTLGIAPEIDAFTEPDMTPEEQFLAIVKSIQLAPDRELYEAARQLLQCPRKVRIQIQQSLLKGRELVMGKALTAEIYKSPMFNSKFLADTIGTDASRISKFRDKHCREKVDFGVVLALVDVWEIGIVDDIPLRYHAFTAGLCRGVPKIANKRILRSNTKYRPPFEVIAFQAGVLSNFLAYDPEFDELRETDWNQFSENNRLPSGYRLQLLEKLTQEANRVIKEYPRFALAIGSIETREVPAYLAEAVRYLPWWVVACEVTWELLEGSGIPVIGVFDPFRVVMKTAGQG